MGSNALRIPLHSMAKNHRHIKTVSKRDSTGKRGELTTVCESKIHMERTIGRIRYRVPILDSSRQESKQYERYFDKIYVPILFKLVVKSRFAVDSLQTDVIAAILSLININK